MRRSSLGSHGRYRYDTAFQDGAELDRSTATAQDKVLSIMKQAPQSALAWDMVKLKKAKMLHIGSVT